MKIFDRFRKPRAVKTAKHISDEFEFLLSIEPMTVPLWKKQFKGSEHLACEPNLREIVRRYYARHFPDPATAERLTTSYFNALWAAYTVASGVATTAPIGTGLVVEDPGHASQEERRGDGFDPRG